MTTTIDTHGARTHTWQRVHVDRITPAITALKQIRQVLFNTIIDLVIFCSIKATSSECYLKISRTVLSCKAKRQYLLFYNASDNLVLVEVSRYLFVYKIFVLLTI